MSVSNTAPFRVLFGDEDYLINVALAEFRESSRRQLHFLDGDGMQAAELVDFCETFSEESRGVIVDEANKLKNVEALLPYVSGGGSKWTAVLFVVRSDNLKESWAKIAKQCKCVQFSKPKPWELDKQCRRISDEAVRAGVSLEDGVAEMLLRYLGYDLSLIANELRKFAYLQTSSLTKKGVAETVPQLFPIQPHDIAEAAASKNSKKALNLLGLYYRNIGEGAAVPVTYALMRVIERILIARNMSDQGCSAKEISERVGMHEYAYQKNLQPLVGRHTVPRLVEQMQNLCKLDALTKGTSGSKRTQVELAVLSLAS